MFQGQPASPWGPVATIAAALVSAGATFRGTYFTLLKPRENKRFKLAPDRLKSTANRLRNMAKDFEDGKIPTEEGHRFNVIVEFFEADTEIILKENTNSYLARLWGLQRGAFGIDDALENQNLESKEWKQKRDEWCPEARGVAGELDGWVGRRK